MENKILLLTEEDMYDIEHNKNLKVEKIKQGFELFEIGDKELKGAILKINNIDKPLEEVKDTCYLAKSELYNKNVYYPIDKYDECYEADFYKIISSVAFNMGASYIKIYAKNEESNNNKKEKETQFKRKDEINAKLWEADIKLEDEINLKSDNKNNFSIDKSEKIMFEDRNKNTRMTKEEFSSWIEKEGINEKALTFFENRINHFKEKGEALGEWNLKWEKSEYSKSVNETFKKIKAGISLLPSELLFIKESFSAIFRKVEDNEKKLLKEFCIHIEF